MPEQTHSTATGPALESPPPRESLSPDEGASRYPFPLAVFALLVSALGLYYAQPGTGGTGWLAWVALIPFFAFIRGRRPRAAFGLGFLWGLAYNLLILVWLRPFGPPPWLALSFIQAFSPAVFALVASRTLSRGGWAGIGGTAALWTLSEAWRAFVSFGLSWGDLSLTQVNFLSALHTASWWGAAGLSFLVALANAASAECLVRSAERGSGPLSNELPSYAKGKRERTTLSALSTPHSALITLGLVLLSVGFGAWGLHRKQRALAATPPRDGKIGLVQANISRTVGGDYLDSEQTFRAYETLTDGLARQGCRWVLWPESATPDDIWDKDRRLSEIARRNRIYLLAGGFDESERDHTYNAVFCYGPDGKLLDTYRKRRIVPFGEFVPWRRYLPPLDRFGVPSTDLTPGRGQGVIRAGGLRIGLNVCFESLFPTLALSQRRDGADLLAVATNDAYYGRTPAAAFHAASLQLRAVETGLPAVQAATTGFSLAVLPDGRITHSSGLFERAALTVDLPASAPKPFWVAAPWLTWIVIFALAFVGIGAGWSKSSGPGK